MIEEEERAYLNWWTESGTASDMAATYPDCACESAMATPEGFGPVKDSEIIRYFVVSRSDMDLKRRPNKDLTYAMFSRIFQKGVSTVRLGHANREELNQTAKILFDHQVKECGEYGGIMGVVDFQARSVRQVPDFDFQVCCVLDTPLDGRMSHADVVSSLGDVESEKKKNEIKVALFNAIGGVDAFKRAANIDDCDLIDMCPAKLGLEPRKVVPCALTDK